MPPREDNNRYEIYYRDVGCPLWHSCICCPFPDCQYSETVRKEAARLGPEYVVAVRRKYGVLA